MRLLKEHDSSDSSVISSVEGQGRPQLKTVNVYLIDTLLGLLTPLQEVFNGTSFSAFSLFFLVPQARHQVIQQADFHQKSWTK